MFEPETHRNVSEEYLALNRAAGRIGGEPDLNRAEGAEMVAGDRSVGSLRSIGESPAPGAPVVLAPVRVEVEPGSRVWFSGEGGETLAEARGLLLTDFAPP